MSFAPILFPNLKRIAWALLACVWLLPTFALHADVSIGRTGDKKKKKDKTEVPVPEPHSETVRFGVGRSTTIELIASVGNTRQVYFTIREQPENGTLSEVQPASDGNKAVVVYTHRPDAPLTDHFSFVCRQDGGSTSPPGEITLNGQKLEAKLNIVEYPHFGNCFASGELSARVVVKNEGQVAFAQEVKWSPPWDGPAYLEINPGETKDFSLSFHPDGPGFYRLEQELQTGNAASKLITSAECVRGLIISPGALSLAYNAGSRGREGALSLSNNRDELATVKISLPNRLKGLAEVTVQPHDKKSLLLSIDPDDIEAFQGQVQFQSDMDTQNITVTAAPKPGEVLVIQPANLVMNFGKLAQRVEGSAEVVLKNSGGQPIAIQAIANPPARVNTSNEAFRLQPGETRTLNVKLSGASLGAYNGQLNLQTAGGEQSIILKAQIFNDAEAPEPDVAASARGRLGTTIEAGSGGPETVASSGGNEGGPKQLNRLQLMYETILATKGIPIPQQWVNPYLESAEGLKVVKKSASSVTLEWNKPKVAPADWIVEQAFYMVDRRTNIYGKFWQKYPNYKVVATSGDKVGISINALKPGSRYETRVLAQDRDGKVSEPSASIWMSTAPSWRVPGWAWYLLVLTGMGIALYFLHRVRRGDFAGAF